MDKTTNPSMTFVATDESSARTILGLHRLRDAYEQLQAAQKHLEGQVNEQTSRRLSKVIADANSVRHKLLEDISYGIDPSFHPS